MLILVRMKELQLNNIYITSNPCCDLLASCGVGVELSICAPLSKCDLLNKWKVESGKWRVCCPLLCVHFNTRVQSLAKFPLQGECVTNAEKVFILLGKAWEVQYA